MRDDSDLAPVETENSSHDKWKFTKLVGTVKPILETPDDPIDIWIHEDETVRCITCDLTLDWKLTPYEGVRSHIKDHIDQFKEEGDFEAAIYLRRVSTVLKRLINAHYGEMVNRTYAPYREDFIGIAGKYHRVEKVDAIRPRFKFK